MAGDSRTPLAKKLGIKAGSTVAFVQEPEGFATTLGDLPDDVRIKRTARGPLDVIVFFTRRRAELERRLEALGRAIHPAGGLWIAWPKRASGVS